MSFSCSDFVECCDSNATDYEVPDLTEAECRHFDIEPDPAQRTQDDNLRLLAERVARAMDSRKKLLEVAEQAEYWLRVADEMGELNVKPVAMLQSLREAIADAGGTLKGSAQG